MNTLLIILIAIAGTVALVWGTIGLFDLITRDGYGVRPGPRSHEEDSGTWRRAA